LELLKKHAAARMRNGVVGRIGTKIPISPVPVKKMPAMISMILTGLLKVFLSAVSSFTVLEKSSYELILSLEWDQ
jgi:hypothetical protein